MLDKYFLACLVFTLVKNAVGEISLDYYFGFEDALRTARYMENCNSDGVKESCQQRCGPNHACLLGKCFCVEVKPQIKKDEALIRQLKNDAAGSSPRHGGHQEDYDEVSVPESLNTEGLEAVLAELLRRSKPEKEGQKGSSNDDSSSESEESGRRFIDLRRGFLGHGCHSLVKADECLRTCSVTGQQGFCDENQECNCGVYRNNFVGRSIKMSNMYTKSRAKYIPLEELGLRPTLRHHIAHFCPNLDVARDCIHKCMMVRKPAFCGKDHVCYCGHKYGTPKDGSNEYSSSEEKYGMFADLYEKYFGPKHKPKHPKVIIHAVTTPRTTTVSATATETEMTTESTTEVTTESTTEESTTEESTTEESTTEQSTTEESTTETLITTTETLNEDDNEE